MWNLCNVETNIISVERIQQYTSITSEADLVIEEKRPPPSWPIQGTIELRNLQVCVPLCSIKSHIDSTFYPEYKVLQSKSIYIL